MRLVGANFASRAEPLYDDAFQDVMKQAVEVLCGRGLPREDADENRTRLLSRFRWMPVDEYQDLGPEPYELIAAVAGRSVEDGDEGLGLFAVGNDDQNVYAFRGRLASFHPPLRPGLRLRAPLPQGQLPVHRAHCPSGQHGHRVHRRPHEGGTFHPHRQGSPRRPLPNTTTMVETLDHAGNDVTEVVRDSARPAPAQ